MAPLYGRAGRLTALFGGFWSGQCCSASCDNAFHLGCLRPRMAKVPAGAWHCKACAGKNGVLMWSAQGSVAF
jgi:hypothetical protein